VLDEIPECDDPEGMTVCGIRKKRTRSGYQVFIGECLKTKGLKGQPFGAAASKMKECAEEWRLKKNAGQA
jgi:hypothetical protein